MFVESNDSTVNVFLSHDIDYSRTGPDAEHIMKRRDRFDDEEFARLQQGRKILYYNVRDLMELEEELGVRSTFFFRPSYETGDLEGYRDDIRDLQKGGWEVGLHANEWSNIAQEKETLEGITGQKVNGCRVHFLRASDAMYAIMRENGFKYDSSVCHSRDRLDIQNTHIGRRDGIVVFPITLMDAYLFTYMKAREEDLVPLVAEAIRMTREGGDLLTILWHDTSLKMKGGRRYRDLLEYIVSEEVVSVVPGLEAYTMFSKGGN